MISLQEEKDKLRNTASIEMNFQISENYDIASENFMTPISANEISEYDFFVEENLESLEIRKIKQGKYEIIQNFFNDLDGCWGNRFVRVILKNNLSRKEYIFNASNEMIAESNIPFNEVIIIKDFCKSCGCAPDSYMYIMLESGVYKIAYELTNLNIPKCMKSEYEGYNFSEQRENRYNIADKIIYTHIKRPKCEESRHRIDNPILEEVFVVIKINSRFPEIFRFYNQGIPAKYRDEWELAEREK